MASFLLAALWGLSVFAGWGTQAFCDGDDACGDRLGDVSTVSGLFAVLAACCTAAAWLLPASRRREKTFSLVMGIAVLAWVAAEGVLFLGGLIAS